MTPSAEPFAYVSLKPCGCISVVMTPEFAVRNIDALHLEWTLQDKRLNSVSLEEYNRLKMKCDSCYRKE